MKRSSFSVIGSRWLRRAVLSLVGLAIFSGPLSAYPPAPFHLFYGMLRDEYGTPINSGAEVILETSSGVRIKTSVIPGIEVGANYRLEVPMDSGLIAAPYQPTALRPTVPFRIKVRVGGVDYLPIEMRGDFSQLGQSGQRTRLNLTLGEDSNGDGLPDAWQRLINADLSKVGPGTAAGNGLTYLQTYYAGTYVIDPKSGFALNIAGFNQGAPLLEFVAVTGRTYTLEGSTDLKNWRELTFHLSTEDNTAPARASFLAATVQQMRIAAVVTDNATPPTYFRLKLQ